MVLNTVASKSQTTDLFSLICSRCFVRFQACVFDQNGHAQLFTRRHFWIAVLLLNECPESHHG